MLSNGIKEKIRGLHQYCILFKTYGTTKVKYGLQSRENIFFLKKSSDTKTPWWRLVI